MGQYLSMWWHRLMKKAGRYLCLGTGIVLLTVFPAIARTITTPNLQAVNSSPVAQATPQKDGLKLLQIGKAYYNNGQLLVAIAAWQQAVEQFTAQRDELNQAVALGNLALAYQQLGRSREANQAIASSLKLLSNSQNTHPNRSRLAEAYNIQGSVQLAQGQAEQAQLSWQRAVDMFRQEQDESGEVRALINQTQALRALGLYLHARSTLEWVNQVLQNQSDSLVKAAGLLSYGDTLRLIGDLKRSQAMLEQSLKIAQRMRSSAQIATTYLSLGNTARAQRQPTPAVAFRRADDYYQSAIATAPSVLVGVQAQLNQLRLFRDAAPENQRLQRNTVANLADIAAQLSQLPLSRPAIYARINYADILMQLHTQGQDIQTAAIAQILTSAVQQARELQDRRAESYALGYLGTWYEQQQQWSQAQGFTEQALMLSEISNAPDISYRWLWQLGRLLNYQGKQQDAIAAYSNAVKTLGRIRNDLVSSNLDVQFSFRESVEPVYRELVGLLLQPSPSHQPGVPFAEVSQTRLKQAREVIESLQLAELDNFFREACLEARSVQIDQIDSQAAVLYPIILPDRLDVVLSLPDESLRHHSHPIPQSDLEQLVGDMLTSLARQASNRDHLPTARQFYDLLIRPFAAELTSHGTKTLAFVLDGPLRNVPMALLHDGHQYLIEQYSLALTPGMMPV